MIPTFWIVAGGPSLRGVDLRFLQREDVIAVNRAYELIEDTSNLRVWWTDYRFWWWHAAQLKELKHARLHSANDRLGRHLQYPSSVRIWQLTGPVGLERAEGGLRHGNNGGFAAINLAYHLGARRIILLGYDMKLSADGAGHWHEEHPWGRLRSRTLKEKMLPAFRGLAQELEKEGVEVINANLDSALLDFPRRSLQGLRETLK